MSRTRHTAADEPHFLVRTVGASFADGDTNPPHAHRWGQLIYAATGVVTVWTEHGSWVVPPHWAVWAPAGVRHELHFTGASALRTLYLRPDIAHVADRSSVVTVTPLLRELILRAVDLKMLDERERAHRAIAELIVQECAAAAAPPLDLPLPRSERLRRVADHLSRRPRDRASLSELARRFGLGLRTLERGFAAETGLSPGQWRRQLRFMHALRQLGTGVPVKRVASEAGYRTPSAFIAAFRTSFQTTPARYFARGRER